MQDNSWLGFTLGSWEMDSVDYLIFQTNGKDSVVGDYYRTGLSTNSVKRDAVKGGQNWKIRDISVSKDKALVKMVAYRKLKAFNKKDFGFELDKPIKVSFVLNPISNDWTDTSSTETGKFELTIPADGSDAFTC